MRAILAAALAASAFAPVAQAQTFRPSPAPAAPAAPVDPQRLAVARVVVVKLLPDGLYRRLMDGTMRQMMGTMVGSMGDMPIRDLAGIAHVDQATLKRIGEAKLREVMAIYDPHWERRTRLGLDAMMSAMADLMDGFEPRMREALARAYAAEFSVAELEEIQRFFATPTGAHYSSRSTEIFMSPEITKATTELMPEIMAKMPKLVEQAMAAAKDVPPPRKIGDLTPDERRRIGELLGIDPSVLAEPASEAEPKDDGTRPI